MSDSKITIYGAEWCAFCHMAMDYLDKRKISYKYIDIDEDPKYALEVIDKSGQRGIPVLDIAGDIIVGFDKPKIDQSIKSHQIA